MRAQQDVYELPRPLLAALVVIGVLLAALVILKDLDARRMARAPR